MATEPTASLGEFNEMKSKLPGDRQRQRAVGPYVLELYTDPLGQRPRVVIEVNKLSIPDESKLYLKEGSIWFNPDDYEDPLEAATDAFDKMSSQGAIEAWLQKAD